MLQSIDKQMFLITFTIQLFLVPVHKKIETACKEFFFILFFLKPLFSHFYHYAKSTLPIASSHNILYNFIQLKYSPK